MAHAANCSNAVGRNEWRHLGRGRCAVKDCRGRRPCRELSRRSACSHTGDPLHLRVASRWGHLHSIRATIAMRALLDVILLALQLYIWLLIAAAVLSWLIAFNVVNVRNQFVAHDRRVSLPHHRAGAAADPQPDAQPRRPRHFAGDPHSHHLFHSRMSSRSTSTPTCSEPVDVRSVDCRQRRPRADSAPDAERRPRRDRRRRAAGRRPRRYSRSGCGRRRARAKPMRRWSS